MPPTLFVAASRQVGRLAAAELCGFVPSYAVLSRWEASFPDPAEPGTPLRCTVRQATAGGGRADGRVSRDAAGRPVADLRLTFLQGSRIVARVSASVSQDC
ncbi:hypothetical protein [Streptomyces sp. CC210A]|uniref:hypothetical protein n=1 Tax=Streptomyces sp. CC210A TaxID=2898184 RepID=UPI001F4511AD|nr:hypothetical protein [Streptomyces sp. CC210A]